jgi:DNA invertase Pin-like site-specific DNA recombinase
LSAPRRVIGYCRVSSVEQARGGTSLDGQREEIARWCRTHHYPEPSLRVEVESGSAEKTERRVEQLRLVAEAEPGDLIVVIAVDRWSRDIVHAVQSVRALVKRGVRWYSIREALDAATSHGDSTLGIMAWTADQERRRIRERTVGRRRELADAGHYVAGRVPLGYRRTAGRKLVVVPEEAAIVHDIFERRARGESLSEIAAVLPVTREHATWNVHSIHRVLHRRYVLGEQRRGDKTWLADAYPPLISHDLWERAHAAARALVRGGRKYSKGDSARRLLRGLARCSGCGRRVSVRFGSRHQLPDPEGRRIHYYVCRGVLVHECDEGWLRAHELDDDAERLILGRLVELRAELARPPVVALAKAHVDVAAARARIEASRRRAVDAMMAGAMSADDLRKALARLDEQSAKVRRDEERARADREAEERAADPARRAAVLEHVHAVETAWTNMTIGAKREALALLAKTVEVGRGVLRFTWRTAAEMAADADA